MTYRIGVDVGGTHTDFAIYDQVKGKLYVEKVASTPRDPAEGIIKGLKRIFETGVAPWQIDFFSHGTTVCTNNLIELKGAKIGLLITKGFRGIQEVQNQYRRAGVYDIFFDKPYPLVLPSLTAEVLERMDYEGNVLQPINREEVRSIVLQLRNVGVQAIAVCYLFSFMNPSHELMTKEIINEVFPGCNVSLSSEILPRIREWPRLSTTLLNAYLDPPLIKYVDHLTKEMQKEGVTTKQLFIMQSNGGVMPFTAVLEGGKTVYTILSGPAAGVQAGAYFASLCNFKNVITMDMGGTSCDIAFIQDAKPLEVTEGEVEDRDLYSPMMDITSIGAGGGTLAWLDQGNFLNIGPQSAGADPGPACYGKGGQNPTVTDADLLLGYLNPDYFLGGNEPLDKEIALQAIEEKIARPLQMRVTDAALGIVRLVNLKMANKIRVMAAKKGVTVRDYVLISFGGAGPVHAAAVAEELGVVTILCPPRPGAFSALGLLCTDIRHDYVRSELRVLTEVSSTRILEIFSQLEDLARQELVEEGLSEEDAQFYREMDLRYAGQGYELRVPVAGPGQLRIDKAKIRSEFDSIHQRLHGHMAADEAVEVVSYWVRVIVNVVKYSCERASEEPVSQMDRRALVGKREVIFSQTMAPVITDVYRRDSLAFGNLLRGPAIVEQVDATVVIPPGWVGFMDQYGNLLLKRGEENR